MTREDLARFAALPIDFGAIGLLEPGVPQEPYFCDPVDGEPVGRLGCDGVHFILLPGDERLFCVDPAMGEPGHYVLPVAEDFRQFLSFVLFCGDANPISQIWWTEEEQFRDFLKEESERSWEGMEDVLEPKRAGGNMIPEDPVILLSFVNTKLRDEYPSLDELCASLGENRAKLERKLTAIGYNYDPQVNQFR